MRDSHFFLLLPALLFFAGGCSSTRSGEQYFVKGNESWEAGRDDQAIKTFMFGLKKAPDHEQMRLNLARIYYERGEKPYLSNRRLLRQVEAAEDRKDTKATALLQTQAENRHKEADIHYRACNEQLDELLAKSSAAKIIAHSAYLRFRTAMFFEDWKIARNSLQQAIDKGGVEGTRKAKYEGFLRQLNKETPGPLIDTSDS
jgi:tetratricopeptide (TPR) repeat protein